MSLAKPQKRHIPFFSVKDSCSTTSESSFASSRSSSFFESFSFAKSLGTKVRGLKKSKSYMEDYMNVWSNIKPSTKKPCLPCDDILTSNNPFMTMSPFTLEVENSYSNLVGILANAVRREVADMYVYILPSLMESSVSQLSRTECLDLQRWWGGFGEFLFAVLGTVAEALRLQRGESAEQLGRLTAVQRRDLRRELDRTMERLTITSELPIKAMNRKVGALADTCSQRALVEVEDMWDCFARFALLTLDDSYVLSRTLEKKSGKLMASGVQERLVQNMLVPVRMGRAAEMSNRTANIVICLCRWLPSAEMARQMVRRWFKKGISRNMDSLCVRYVNRRRISMFQFERRPAGGPGVKKHSPSRVKFALSDSVQLF